MNDADPMNVRRCSARNRAGGRCGRAPIAGGMVCHLHGGAAPQVRKAAAERIAELVEPALVEMARIIESGDTDSVRLAACRDILDRAGYGARQRIDIEQRVRVMAEQLGLDPDAAVAEAVRVLREAKG